MNSETQRQDILDLYDEGKSEHEIATILGIPLIIVTEELERIHASEEFYYVDDETPDEFEGDRYKGDIDEDEYGDW